MNFEFQDTIDEDAASLEQLRLELAREYPGVPSVPRRRFVMADDLAEMVLDRQKCTTIRFDKHAVEYPIGVVLPLYSLEKGQDHGQARCRADVLLHAVRYEQVKNLTEADAIADGFRTRGDLIETLETFYGELSPTDVVCIYAFSLMHTGPQRRRPVPFLSEVSAVSV